MMPLLCLLAPGMAWLLSDFRTLPAILISIPAVFLLGCCAVYSGWFYGRGDMLTPAQCECSEQIVRFVGSLVLLLIFTRSPLSRPCRAAGFCRNSGGYLRLDDVPPPCAAAAGCAIRRFAS